MGKRAPGSMRENEPNNWRSFTLPGRLRGHKQVQVQVQVSAAYKARARGNLQDSLCAPSRVDLCEQEHRVSE